MNYWHMQLHPNNPNWGKEVELLQTLGLIGLGEWEEKGNQQDFFENKMERGDIVAIKRAGTLIALVEVTGDYEYYEETGNLDWFERRRPVKVLDWYKSEYNYYVSPRGTLTRCNTNNEDAESNVSIITWHNKTLSRRVMTETKKILLYKNQIILQGPPGTGKTRLGKLLAEDLTKPISIGKPIEIINSFFSLYDSKSKILGLKRDERRKLLTDFQLRFSIDNLPNMSLEEYCVGKGDRDNFCWWIETGLKVLGKYSPGSSRSYLIYWSQQEEVYKRFGRLLKDSEANDDDAMSQIALLIYEIVSTKDPASGLEYFGDSFILKILNSYYPDEFFPINGKESLNNALRLFGINPAPLTNCEKNKKLNELFKAKRQEFNTDIDSFEFMRFLFENFNLKTGEDLDLNQVVVSGGEYKIVQFHPAYSYEDFVRGIIASATEKGIEYKTENKILIEFAQKAIDNPNANYVLIIDEMNRANLPAVLGELIYALEYRGEEVTSMYEFENDRQIVLPKNLFIIGTMNTADRSVGHIDYAIRRRFAFVNVLPEDLTEQLGDEFDQKRFLQVSELFSHDSHLSKEFDPKDVQLGHSYFIDKSKYGGTFDVRLQYEIKPILLEYVKDGILIGDDIIEKIERL